MSKRKKTPRGPVTLEEKAKAISEGWTAAAKELERALLRFARDMHRISEKANEQIRKGLKPR